VLSAVDFDNEAAFETDKVGNVGTERHLSPEPLTKLAAAQPAPEPGLGIGEAAPELSGTRVRHA
jgi:hypothetical protein